MKIQNEQLRALQEAEARRAKTLKDGDAFGALLTRQLDSGPVQDAAAPEYALAPGLRSLRLDGLAGNADPCAASLKEAAAGDMDDMLGAFERYSRELARDDKADLRRAFSLLEDMSSRMDGFASRFAGLRERQPELAAIFNELDVLVSTETFKFNRGDYL